MNVKGKITKILDTKTGTSKAGKEWKKTSFLLETDKNIIIYIALMFLVKIKLKNLSNGIMLMIQLLLTLM